MQTEAITWVPMSEHMPQLRPLETGRFLVAWLGGAVTIEWINWETKATDESMRGKIAWATMLRGYRPTGEKENHETD